MNLKNYAETILNDEKSHAEVQTRIHLKMLRAFRAGDRDKRDTISDMMNATDLFMAELRVILSEGEIDE